MSRILTCEQVSDGHPDKICDQVADAIVTDCLVHDKESRVAIECLLKDSRLIIAGELTSRHQPDYRKLADDVLERIGKRKTEYGRMEIISPLDVALMVRKQSPDIALGVDKGGAGDQGIMFGYATNETPELLPVPFAVATKFLRLLKNHPPKMFRANAKAQVSFDYSSGRITAFLCSMQHSPDVEVSDFRHIIEGMMVLAACGVTGRKLACDTYGGTGRIGGGALSGKDPSKVDRSAAYMARKIARDIVQAGYAEQCEIQIAYAIGMEHPVSVNVDCFGTEYQTLDFIQAYVGDSYDLTPRGIINRLHLLDVDYNLISAYGHFGKPGLPWEE